MKKLVLSKECILEKDCDAITRELLKGNFIIACDIEKNERRMLRFEIGIMITGSKDVYDDIYELIKSGLVDFDTFIIDKHNNLYTEVVYDKYGGSM